MCVHCGTALTGRRTRFCSEACVRAFRRFQDRIGLESKRCEHCKGSMGELPRNAKFCSQNCADRSKNVVFEPRPCVVCGNTFTPSRGNHVTCSSACSRARDYGERTCVVCGTVWLTTRPDAKFCSKPCALVGQVRGTRKPTSCPLPEDHPITLEIARQKESIAKQREIDRAARLVTEAAEKILRRSMWASERNCLECGVAFCPLYTPVQTTCSKRCSKRRERRSDRGYMSWGVLYHEDGPACHLCGQDTDPDDFLTITSSNGVDAFLAGPMYPTVDHVIPKSKGGSHDRENLRLAHFKCNWTKSDATLDLAQAI